jgi:hypothetical protein
VQLAEREAAVAGLEAQQVELAQQQVACDALAAQLQQRSEVIAAEAQTAAQAAKVHRVHHQMNYVSQLCCQIWPGSSKPEERLLMCCTT